MLMNYEREARRFEIRKGVEYEVLPSPLCLMEVHDAALDILKEPYKPRREILIRRYERYFDTWINYDYGAEDLPRGLVIGGHCFDNRGNYYGVCEELAHWEYAPLWIPGTGKVTNSKRECEKLARQYAWSYTAGWTEDEFSPEEDDVSETYEEDDDWED